MNIFNALKLCRTQARIGQKEVADLAGISVSYLSLLEQGKRNPSLSTIEKISLALGVSSPILFFLCADEDGLEKIDKPLAERLVSTAFQIAIKG